MKSGKDLSFTTDTHITHHLWASPREYLRKSTLSALARNQLTYPGSIYHLLLLENTFGDQDFQPRRNFSPFSSDILSEELREAILTSSRGFGNNDSKPVCNGSSSTEIDDEEELENDYQEPAWEETVELIEN